MDKELAEIQKGAMAEAAGKVEAKKLTATEIKTQAVLRKSEVDKKIRLYTPVQIEGGQWVVAKQTRAGFVNRVTEADKTTQFSSQKEAFEAARLRMAEENPDLPVDVLEMFKTIAILANKKDLANIEADFFRITKKKFAKAPEAIRKAIAESKDLQETITNLNRAITEEFEKQITPTPEAKKPVDKAIEQKAAKPIEKKISPIGMTADEIYDSIDAVVGEQDGFDIVSPFKKTVHVSTREEALRIRNQWIKEAQAEAKPQQDYETYKENMRNATEKEVVVAMAEDGLRPPAEMLEKYKELPSIERILEQDEIDRAVKKAAQKPVEVPKVVKKAEIEKPEQQEVKKLRQRIHATAAVKGLTKKALSDLKLKHTGYRTLSGKVAGKKITTDQLKKLLNAVQRTRPKRIGYKEVITKKTENKIQSLKESLKKKLQMTDEAFAEILQRETHGRQPKYENAKSFITEKQGKDIIKRMHDTAEVLKATLSFDKAVEKNPEIKKQVDRLLSELEGKRKIFTMYMDLLDTNLENHKTRHARIAALETAVPGFKEIAGDEESLKRVSQYIASQSTLKDRPAVPENITKSEINLAKEIQKIFTDYELKARVNKFFNWYYYNEDIAEFDRFKKEIHKAEDIFESQGKEELIKYLKTQTWGVVKSGYEPLESVVMKIRPYKVKGKTVGKGHIKIRTDIEYHTQERNILQRLNSYMRQMDMLYNLSPKINALVRLYEDNMSQFAEPRKITESIEHFLSNLKKYNIEGGWVGDQMARLYAQASQIIIMAQPVLAGRNLFQNAAFEHDKSILFDPRNENLTTDEIEYMETYVQQLRGMMEEFFMINERSLPGTKTLMKVLRKIKIYAWSDATNRQWGFWAKINQVKRAQKAESISEMMERAKFEDMSELEQIRALGILARDGNEAMARYVSRVHIDDIHFLYERAQRSPAEMGSLGRVFGNLMLFPRAYTEKLAHQVSKLTSKTSSQQERYRAAKILVSVMGGGIMVGTIYSMMTGRRNPYNPLNILSFRLGGLILGLTEDVNETYNLSMRAIGGDKKALYALTTLLPQQADRFIPFYDWTLRGLEAVTDTKNIDRYALRQIYAQIDKEYKSRKGAYTMKRNFVQALQFVFAGPSIDRKIEEEAKKKKGGRKTITRK
jgi:hypothetical protein